MATGTAGDTARNYHTYQTHYLIKQILYTDDGTELSMGYVPAGSIIVDARCEVETAFDDSGNDYVIIGNASDPNEFCNNLDVSGTGTKLDATTFNAAADKVYTSATEIVCQYDGANSNASAGLAYAIVQYVVDPSVVDTSA